MAKIIWAEPGPKPRDAGGMAANSPQASETRAPDIPPPMMEAEEGDKLEFKWDDAWFAAVLELKKGAIRVRFDGFEDEETWSVDAMRKMNPLCQIVRVASEQLQDEDCDLVKVNQAVCALSPVGRHGWYDATVVEVNRRLHSFEEDGTEICTCAFAVVWLDGPSKGSRESHVQCEHICLHSKKDVETHPLLRAMLYDSQRTPASGEPPDVVRVKPEGQNDKVPESGEPPDGVRVRDEGQTGNAPESGIGKSGERQKDNIPEPGEKDGIKVRPEGQTETIPEPDEMDEVEVRPEGQSENMPEPGELPDRVKLRAEGQMEEISEPSELQKRCRSAVDDGEEIRNSKKHTSQTSQCNQNATITITFDIGIEEVWRDSNARRGESYDRCLGSANEPVEPKVSSCMSNGEDTDGSAVQLDFGERSESLHFSHDSMAVPEAKAATQKHMNSVDNAAAEKTHAAVSSYGMSVGGTSDGTGSSPCSSSRPKADLDAEERTTSNPPTGAPCVSQSKQGASAGSGLSEKDAICLTDEDDEPPTTSKKQHSNPSLVGRGDSKFLEHSTGPSYPRGHEGSLATVLQRLLSNSECVLKIDNLELDVQPVDVMDLLSKFGARERIHSVHITPPHPDMIHALGYAVFVDREAADVAFAHLGRCLVVSTRGRPWKVSREGRDLSECALDAATNSGYQWDTSKGQSQDGDLGPRRRLKIIESTQQAEYEAANRRQDLFEEQKRQARAMYRRHAAEEQALRAQDSLCGVFSS